MMMTCPVMVLAQTGTITGTVTDSISGAALSGVTINLTKWSQQGKWNWGTVNIGSTQTDAQGHYSFTGVEPTATWESYTLNFTKPGYAASSILTFTLAADSTKMLNKRLFRTAGVLMHRAGIAGRGLRITAGNGRIFVEGATPDSRLTIFSCVGKVLFSGMLSGERMQIQAPWAESHQPQVLRITTRTMVFTVPLMFP